MRTLCWIPLLALALGCAALDGWAPPLVEARPELRPGPAADVSIDARDPGSGVLTVEMAIAGLPARRFAWRGSLDEVALSMPTFWGADGRRIAYERERDGFRLERPPGSVVRVRYRVRPGGPGRHGRQGVVTTEFASFDGRIFLLPVEAAGLRDVRIRVRTPEGWRVASPFREDGDELRLGAELAGDTLAGSCLALGPFERSTRTIGTTEYRVFTHALWSEAHRMRLNEKSFRIFDWFHRELGFDPGAPYAVVWTPDADGERVFGGSYANGTCMEHPTEDVRNFELLAHRLGHAMNGYPPTGLQLGSDADDWFSEGWASYVELAATRGSGVTADDSRWEALHERYLRERVAHPERDVPLELEPQARRGQTAEFLHYVKGPLVVAMLADWIRARSRTSLEAFMAAMWAEHGRYRSPLELRPELEAFTGLDLDPFWQRMVEVRGHVIPVWQAPEPATEPPVATVAGQPIPLDYLLFLAGSGEFPLYADVVSFLEEEERTRAVLARRGARAGFPEFPDSRATLSPARRHALARHAAEVVSALAPVAGGAESPRLRFAPDHPAAKTFELLLAREREYLAELGQRGVGTIAVRPLGGVPCLVVAREKPVLLFAHWLWSPREPRAVALEEGKPTLALRVRGAHPKGLSQSLFTPETRARGEVVEFELSDGDRPLARRAFWQRGSAPAEDE